MGGAEGANTGLAKELELVPAKEEFGDEGGGEHAHGNAMDMPNKRRPEAVKGGGEKHIEGVMSAFGVCVCIYQRKLNQTTLN